MTINSTTRKAGPFIGNGSTSAFPFSFKVFQASDLEVVRLDESTNTETSLVLTSDYTVTLNLDQDSNPGGTVTLLAGALAAGYTLTLTSDLPNLQPTDLTNQGGFYPDVINDALDRATIQIQQLQEQTDRSLKVAVSSTADATLPPPAPNDLIGWDATGEALVNVDPTSLATVVAYATAYADVFLGNGITTSWTLTRNPGVLYNLDVSINGSTQEPTRDYTLASDVITFTTAPPLGSRVLVKYKEGLPNYSGDSQDVRFVPAGTGAVTQSVQARLRQDIYDSDYSTLQQAINALSTGQTLHVNNAHVLSAGLTITNKSGIRITGKGSIKLTGAPSGAYIFDLVGTIDNLEIDSITLEGDGVATYSQGGIGCNSGQTISNTRFHDLTIKNINVGISHNANLSGSWTNALCYNNYLENIKGTVPGSGYGIQAARAYNLKIYGNTINNASRHSIYVGRGSALACLIQNNVIINHRKDVYDGSPRCGIDVGRVSGVTISGNTFRDCYDGQIYIGHDTSTGDDCADILVIGNKFGTPKNTVPCIWVGEQLVPTTNETYKIDILDNTFEQDASVTASTSIYVLNGRHITVKNNRFRAYSATSQLPMFVEMGDTRYITSDIHIADITVCDNVASSNLSSTLAGSRLLYVVDQLCTGTSRYTAKNNSCPTWASEYYFEATPTNVNSKLKLTASVTVNMGTIAANTIFSGAYNITGVKPTSHVTVRPQSSLINSPMIAVGGYAKDSVVNAIEIYAVNASTSSSTQVSQSFFVHVEDF